VAVKCSIIKLYSFESNATKNKIFYQVVFFEYVSRFGNTMVL